MNVLSPHVSKYKISRRGRKLQASDDSRMLIALPREISERAWAEILQKEENDLLIFDIREEILEAALKIGYDNYMDRQNAPFTVFCAAQAWLKLIDWHFYRHDPGEEPSAYPPCFIPKRLESWEPDQLPDPSPKDGWCRQDLNVVECAYDETLQRSASNESLDYPVVEDIPREYWFPGKINWIEEFDASKIPDLITTDSYSDASRSEEIGADSELVQRITDYSTVELSKKASSASGLKLTTPVEEGSLHGAGDSTVMREKKKYDKSRHSSRVNVSQARSRSLLPPLDKDSCSHVSIISDCRLRSLRLDTQYEISSEKVDTPPGETVKRK